MSTEDPDFAVDTWVWDVKDRTGEKRTNLQWRRDDGFVWNIAKKFKVCHLLPRLDTYV